MMEVTHEQTGTLRAQTHGHEPIVLENHPMDSRIKIKEDGVFQTMGVRGGAGIRTAHSHGYGGRYGRIHCA